MPETRKKKRDDAVDSVCVRDWFRMIKEALQETSPRDIERLFKPGIVPRNNRFKEFETGLRSPSPATVKRGEELVPRSKLILDSVLWKALRFEHPDIEVPDGWLPLDMNKVATWMLDIDPDFVPLVIGSNHKFRSAISRHYLGKLERRASYDSLAVLTILFRIQQEEGNKNNAWDIAHSIFRVLVILGDELISKDIANQLWDIFDARIFRRISLNGKMIDLLMARCEFEAGALMIATFAEILKHQDPSSKHKALKDYSAKIISGTERKTYLGLVHLPCYEDMPHRPSKKDNIQAISQIRQLARNGYFIR